METMVLEALSVAMKPVTKGLMDSSQMLLRADAMFTQMFSFAFKFP